MKISKLLLALIVSLSGCVAHVKQAPFKAKHEGKSFWLKQSLHGGIFYDDDRYRLLSEEPFEKIKNLRSPTGDYIIPPPADEVVKFGTRVQVNKVEWPTHQNIIKRPFLTPRYLPWVYLTVALDRGDVSLMREIPYILLVPDHIETEEEYNQWISTYLDEKDNNRWFLNLSPSEQDAILRAKK